MPYKDKELQKKYQREWMRAKAAESLKIMRELKNKPCTDCGGLFHYSSMDFDHVDDNKITGVAKLAGTGQIDKMLEEIAKCELVCASCHRYRTWLRNNIQD